MNTFTEKGYTAAHREMDQSLNRDLYDQIIRALRRAGSTTKRASARSSTKNRFSRKTRFASA